MKKFILIGSVLFLFFQSCKNKQDKAKEKQAYEDSKENIEHTEKKSPLQFLSVEGRDKKNILGQTVVKGTVKSYAKLVAYKDIDLKLSFFSKTRSLLEEDHEILYETIQPGGQIEFKSKYFAPKGTDSVFIKVVEAKVE